MQIWRQAYILLGDTTENRPTEGLEQQLHRYLKKVSLFYLGVSPLPSVLFGFALHLLYCMIVSRPSFLDVSFHEDTCSKSLNCFHLML